MIKKLFIASLLIVALPVSAQTAADTARTWVNPSSGTQTGTLSTPGASTGAPGTVSGYTPLEPLKGGFANYRNFGEYLATMYRLVITIGALIAVVMLVTGGVRYMLSEAFTDIDKAKLRIRSALYGLLILVGSFLILYTINPNLLKFDLLIPPLKNQGQSGFSGPTSNETAQANYRKLQELRTNNINGSHTAEECNTAIQWLKENGAYTGGAYVPTNKMAALGCGATYAKNRSTNFEECTNLKQELENVVSVAYSNGCANYR